MELRPYQKEAVANIFRSWEQYKHTLLVLPTGTGKTIVFAKVAERIADNEQRVLILAHREELLTQARDKIKVATGYDAAFEKAEHTAIGSEALITVGSIQTLANEKRLNHFSEDYFNTIIVDEAHHCLSDSYQRVLTHFDKSYVLGVTATPDRGDMRNLGSFFDDLAYEYSLKDAIQQGYLCPIKVQSVPINIDLSGLRTRMGDFTERDIGNIIDPYLEDIADEMVRYCKNRKTVVFLPLIETSKKFRDMLEDRGFNAAEVNGNSPDRVEILRGFEENRYNVLCNSMLLTEGWDCPSVDCVVVLRPTKIRSLYCQMIGRGTRTCFGKDHLLILDFLWHTGRHELCRPACLISKKEDISQKMQEAAEAKGLTDLIETEEAAIRDVRAEREAALARQLEEAKKQKRKLFDPIEYEFALQDDDLINYIPAFGWELDVPSEKQMKAIESFGINPETINSKGHASLLLDKLIKRRSAGYCTPKQIKVLERFGFQNVAGWQFDKASKMIGLIAQNHWNTPKWINPETYTP